MLAAGLIAAGAMAQRPFPQPPPLLFPTPPPPRAALELIWHTCLGGSHSDSVVDLASDEAGYLYVCGTTRSATDFPGLRGHDTVFNGDQDVFVAKLDRDGLLLWSSYLGGQGADLAAALAVDARGDIYVAGRTNSNNFPISNEYRKSEYMGRWDAFVAKFSADGVLRWSTYLGGVDIDAANGIAVDRDGGVLVVGETYSLDFPVPNGFARGHGGGEVDAFLSKFSVNGALEWSTYLGGSGVDVATAVACDLQGAVYVAGWTQSRDFPRAAGREQALAGVCDAFVAKFSPQGRGLWSQYVGGGGWDQATDVAADLLGHPILVGVTRSRDFPAREGPGLAAGGGPPAAGDGFAVKMLPSGKWLWAGYLGGDGDDAIAAVAVDREHYIYVAGVTSSATLADGVDVSPRGERDGFLAQLSPRGVLIGAGRVGGAARDALRGVAVAPRGSIAVAGETLSTTGAAPIQLSRRGYAGGQDGFISLHYFRPLPPEER